MLDSSEQVGAEATPSTVDAFQAVPFEQPGEELVCEIAGVVVASSIASHEGLNGAVVSFAQVAKGVFSFRRLTACRENLSPMRGAKGVRGTITQGMIHLLIPESGGFSGILGGGGTIFAGSSMTLGGEAV